MDYKDYYKILGVARSASADEIKSAYRKSARKYHPDVSKAEDAENRFKDAGEAYEVLGDPDKRSAYDAIPVGGYASPRANAGRSSGRASASGAGFGFGGGHANASGGDFSDFFEDMFGHGQSAQEGFARGNRPNARAQMRGQDLHTEVLVDLEDVFHGAERQISLRSPSAETPGRETTRTLKIRIPKGVRAGQQLRLAGQGGPGRGSGAPAGDLYLDIALATHPIYQLDGRDLIVDLPVAPWEAALGATIKAPTPMGAVDLKIPPGSNGGRRMRLKGRGMPGDTAGNLYVVLRISLPPVDGEMDADTRALYEQMAERLAFNPRAALGV